MHLCRGGGFPDLLRALRQLLGWENARGLRREIFCPFPAAVTATWTSPFSKPQRYRHPLFILPQRLGLGLQQTCYKSASHKFLASETNEKKRASTRSRSDEETEGVARSSKNQPGKKIPRTFRKSRVTRYAHITMVMGMPILLDIAANFSRSRASYFSPQPPSPFLDLVFATFLLSEGWALSPRQARNFPL